MKKIIAVSALALVITLSSCSFVKVNGKTIDSYINVDSELVEATGDIVSQDYSVAGFNTLVCNVPCDLVYKPGAYAVSISAPSDVLDHLEVTVKEGELKIRLDKVKFYSLRGVKINISAPAICGLEFNGAVDFFANEGLGDRKQDFKAEFNGATDASINKLTAKNVNIKVNGAGDVNINALDSKTLDVVVNGAGDVEIGGETGVADITVNGAADVDVRALKASNLYSSINGLGKIRRK